MTTLTQEQLKQIIDYDASTGEFTWLINSGRARKGKKAGSITGHGYRSIKINRKEYLTGRLAFLWMKGRWPNQLVDHINGNRIDNRWLNLREANFQQNSANCRTKKKSGSKKGFSWLPRDRKYQARIRVDGKKLFLGAFDTADQAHTAYVAAAKKYFGEFARA